MNVSRTFVLSGVVAMLCLGSVLNSAGDARGVGVSPDGHHLELGGKPVMLIGDSVTQGWMESGADFDQMAYIDALARRGINALLLWSYIGVTDQVGDSRIGCDAPEIWPWVKSEGRFGLGELNGAYFSRLRALVRYAGSKGMVVIITVHDGWTKTRFAGHPFNTKLGGSLAARDQYVELADYRHEMPAAFDSSWNRRQRHQYWLERFCDRIISETGDQPNVIYELFNEGEWYDRANLRQFQERFLAFFRARTKRLTMVNDPRFHSHPTCDIVSLHSPNYHPSSTALAAFREYAARYAAHPPKPYYYSEPVPEYKGQASYQTALTRHMWGTVIGGAGVVIQNDTSFGWNPHTLMATQSVARDLMYDREGHCCRFFNRMVRNLAGLSPKGGLSSTGVCAANPGSEYVVWTEGTDFTLDLSAVRGAAACRFYDPRTGEIKARFTRPGGKTQRFTPPDGNDWVLHVMATSE